ncbi:7198_t:CDS:2 [Ambispora gerdemannii]|uniref:7198_t:CDS:1 n=1 Tax=Ambispora gerdemannii TaxID=144530 RepID=A0A9N8ZX10_9GLOM|nr:7198_t:CDS:2 [Ambispora gerdemannii]
MTTVNLKTGDSILETNRETINPDTYFVTHTPPKSLEKNEKQVNEFVSKHAAKGSKVVLITSGGTTVPLENQTVRFIDNFSAGTRGATSAEYPFDCLIHLIPDYAVIFMHRQFSLQPYNRHFSHQSILDLLELKPDGSINVCSEYAHKMKATLTKYQEYKRKEMLLMLEFFTVNDYLFLLRSVSHALNGLTHHALYYLAAAAEHKIQSGDGAMTLKMDQVPKFLKPMVTFWAPQGYIVSFKLETDPHLLIPKSRQALIRYGHQIVIGNLLTTRKREVNLITHDSEMELKLSEEEERNGVEIESRIVNELLKRHDEWITNYSHN